MVIKDDFVHEVCRYGAAEPHALAAFIGGCAAHEAIKLLTQQYVPIDNLFLFNAMTLNTLTLKIAWNINKVIVIAFLNTYGTIRYYIFFGIVCCHTLTVDPGADVKDGDTWNFFIVLSVRRGQGE